MNHYLLIALMLAAFGLAACDKPTVVNMPSPDVVPGPAGPSGAAGAKGVQGDAGAKGAEGDQGDVGAQGDAGKNVEGTTVIVVPPENSSPAD